MKEIFVTATDTDAGKTFVTCALIQAIKNSKQGSKQSSKQSALSTEQVVAAFKPISAGCDLIDGALINEDAKLLCDFANAKQSIHNINPIAFKEPIAPHIAAKKQNKQLNVEEIVQHYQQVKAINPDVILTEGAGGWRLPLGFTDNKPNSKPQFLSDFVKQIPLEVVLIVNMKLGCLNHALLSFEAIKADGLQCVAWIANCANQEPMSNLAENIAELEQLLPIPKIAQFDFYPDINEKGEHVSFEDKIKHAAQNINIKPLFA